VIGVLAGIWGRAAASRAVCGVSRRLFAGASPTVCGWLAALRRMSCGVRIAGGAARFGRPLDGADVV